MHRGCCVLPKNSPSLCKFILIMDNTLLEQISERHIDLHRLMLLDSEATATTTIQPNKRYNNMQQNDEKGLRIMQYLLRAFRKGGISLFEDKIKSLFFRDKYCLFCLFLVFWGVRRHSPHWHTLLYSEIWENVYTEKLSATATSRTATYSTGFCRTYICTCFHVSIFCLRKKPKSICNACGNIRYTSIQYMKRVQIT